MSSLGSHLNVSILNKEYTYTCSTGKEPTFQYSDYIVSVLKSRFFTVPYQEMHGKWGTYKYFKEDLHVTLQTLLVK